MNQKNSKIALVTGGNRGIGLAIAMSDILTRANYVFHANIFIYC